MTKIRIVGVVERYYPYRTAKLEGWVSCVTLSDAEVAYVRHKVEKAGYKFDNHCVFSTRDGNFWYSDDRLYIGGKVAVGTY